MKEENYQFDSIVFANPTNGWKDENKVSPGYYTYCPLHLIQNRNDHKQRFN